MNRHFISCILLVVIFSSGCVSTENRTPEYGQPEKPDSEAYEKLEAKEHDRAALETRDPQKKVEHKTKASNIRDRHEKNRTSGERWFDFILDLLSSD